MGMRVSLAFFFSVLSKGKAKKKQINSNKCKAELTEIVEGGSHFSLFFGCVGLNLEQVL